MLLGLDIRSQSCRAFKLVDFGLELLPMPLVLGRVFVSQCLE